MHLSVGRSDGDYPVRLVRPGTSVFLTDGVPNRMRRPGIRSTGVATKIASPSGEAERAKYPAFSAHLAVK